MVNIPQPRQVNITWLAEMPSMTAVETTTLTSAAQLVTQPAIAAPASPDYNHQQVLLAILFGVLATVLGVMGLVNGFLQLRKHNAQRPSDVEISTRRRTISIGLESVRYVSQKA